MLKFQWFMYMYMYTWWVGMSMCHSKRICSSLSVVIVALLLEEVSVITIIILLLYETKILP